MGHVVNPHLFRLNYVLFWSTSLVVKKKFSMYFEVNSLYILKYLQNFFKKNDFIRAYKLYNSSIKLVYLNNILKIFLIFNQSKNFNKFIKKKIKKKLLRNYKYCAKKILIKYIILNSLNSNIITLNRFKKKKLFYKNFKKKKLFYKNFESKKKKKLRLRRTKVIKKAFLKKNKFFKKDINFTIQNYKLNIKKISSKPIIYKKKNKINEILKNLISKKIQLKNKIKNKVWFNIRIRKRRYKKRYPRWKFHKKLVRKQNLIYYYFKNKNLKKKKLFLKGFKHKNYNKILNKANFIFMRNYKRLYFMKRRIWKKHFNYYSKRKNKYVRNKILKKFNFFKWLISRAKLMHKKKFKNKIKQNLSTFFSKSYIKKFPKRRINKLAKFKRTFLLDEKKKIITNKKKKKNFMTKIKNVEYARKKKYLLRAKKKKFLEKLSDYIRKDLHPRDIEFKIVNDFNLNFLLTLDHKFNKNFYSLYNYLTEHKKEKTSEPIISLFKKKKYKFKKFKKIDQYKFYTVNLTKPHMNVFYVVSLNFNAKIKKFRESNLFNNASPKDLSSILGKKIHRKTNKIKNSYSLILDKKLFFSKKFRTMASKNQYTMNFFEILKKKNLYKENIILKVPKLRFENKDYKAWVYKNKAYNKRKNKKQKKLKVRSINKKLKYVSKKIKKKSLQRKYYFKRDYNFFKKYKFFLNELKTKKNQNLKYDIFSSLIKEFNIRRKNWKYSKNLKKSIKRKIKKNSLLILKTKNFKNSKNENESKNYKNFYIKKNLIKKFNKKKLKKESNKIEQKNQKKTVFIKKKSAPLKNKKYYFKSYTNKLLIFLYYVKISKLKFKFISIFNVLFAYKININIIIFIKKHWNVFNKNADLIADLLILRLLQKYKIKPIMSSIIRYLKRAIRRKKIYGYAILIMGRFSRKDRATYSWYKKGPFTRSNRLIFIDYSNKRVSLRFSTCSFKINIIKSLDYKEKKKNEIL